MTARIRAALGRWRSLTKVVSVVALTLVAGSTQAVEFSGSVSGELRGFLHDPSHPGQRPHARSFTFEPEFYQGWHEDRHSLTVAPFLRIDLDDPRRTHVDVRELFYQYVGEHFEARVGLSRVFWGVAESRHLVDIINQTDLVENLDGEDKLGQPMLNLSIARDWGTLDLFALPYFRERTFPGRAGRLRSSPRVDPHRSRYASGARRGRLDWATRYAHSFGDWDIGLSHFHGTAREPRLQPILGPGNEPLLLPHYDTIDQTGLELQATKGNWLWKLEAIRRTGGPTTFNALVGGFEYTLVGVAQTAVDVGLLAELLFDDRHRAAPHPFDRDLFLGTRIAANDEASSELLAGVIVDLRGSARVFALEASRRLGDDWKLALEMRLWGGVSSRDPQHSVRRDDHLQITLSHHF